jgi:hypothetical protein
MIGIGCRVQFYTLQVFVNNTDVYKIKSSVLLYVFYLRAVLQLYTEKEEGEVIKHNIFYHIKLNITN